MQSAVNTEITNTSALSAQKLECGIVLEVHSGFDAYSSDLTTAMLCKSKADLYSPEEASLLAQHSQLDEGVEFDGADYASGLIRLSGVALREGQALPAALALAHLHVEANRGYHDDLGFMLKLHIRIGAGHIHRLGVGVGLHKAVAQEAARQVLCLVKEFQRTCKEDMTVLWSFEQSLAACDDFCLRQTIHNNLLETLYAPMLHITEDSVV